LAGRIDAKIRSLDRASRTKTGDRQDDYLLIHGSKVIVLSVTFFSSPFFHGHP
jgi:hypothetical protein